MNKLLKAADLIESIMAEQESPDEKDMGQGRQIVAALRATDRQDLEKATWMSIFKVIGVSKLDMALTLSNFLESEL